MNHFRVNKLEESVLSGQSSSSQCIEGTMPSVFFPLRRNNPAPHTASETWALSQVAPLGGSHPM